MNSPRLLRLIKELGFDNWQSLSIGFDLGFVTKGEVIAHAVQLLAEGAETSEELVALASADYESEKTLRELLDQLAAAEGFESEGIILDRWRLARLLSLRREIGDEEALLRAVADAYADFGYPEDMKAAVYYMPSAPLRSVDIGEQLESPVTALDRLIGDLRARL